MTVPAAIRELEKIEMIRGLDGRYRMDHAVTATQKTILSAFRMDARSVKNRANELRDLLDKKDAQRKQELLKAMENSPRTYDEIMAFLKAEE